MPLTWATPFALATTELGSTENAPVRWGVNAPRWMQFAPILRMEASALNVRSLDFIQSTPRSVRFPDAELQRLAEFKDARRWLGLRSWRQKPLLAKPRPHPDRAI